MNLFARYITLPLLVRRMHKARTELDDLYATWEYATTGCERERIDRRIEVLDARIFGLQRKLSKLKREIG